MSIPDVVVQFGLDSDPTVAVASTTWTDVSAYVNELPGGSQELVRTVRGKQYELDEFQAGTLQLVLDNRDGRFSPDNTASPYYPNLKPMRRVRILADGYLDTYADTYGEPVWSGFVDEWPQQWLSHAAVQVSVAATDGFKVLHNTGLASSVWAHEVDVDAPTHWWRFAEQSGTTAFDSGTAAHLRNGTYVGSPTLAPTGIVQHDSSDQAVEFDGADDQITFSAAALPSTGEYAIEIVFRLASLPSAGNLMNLIVGPPTGFAESAPIVYLGIDENGDVHYASYVTASGGLSDARNTDLVAGTDYHLMFLVRESTSSAAIFVNGTAIGTSAGVGASVDISTGDMLFGGTEDVVGSRVRFAGVVDELVMYHGSTLGWSDGSTARITAHESAIAEPWDGDLAGTRIGRALDIAEWPTADRDVDAGATTFQDGTFADDDTVLAFVQRAQQSEYGYFFVGPDSTAEFIGRHNLLTEARYTTSQATFSDQPTGTELPYTDLQLDPSSDATVVNDWTVQRKFGTHQNVSDATSIDTYFERSQSRLALMMDNDAEARAQAEWLLAHTKDPVTRIRRMTLDPSGDTDLWDQVLGRELMDRVTVNYRIPGGGSVSKEVHIIGIEHRVSKGRWMCDWWLSPADTQSYLILDDATFGTLDDNRLGY